MSDQAALFDLDEGRRRRDEGIRRIDMASAFDPWRGNAERSIRHRCQLGRPFSANEVRRDVGDPPKPNMFGSLFKWAEKQGLVYWHGEMTPSWRPEAHARLTKLWRPASERLA